VLQHKPILVRLKCQVKKIPQEDPAGRENMNV
jgi:hypothetical protein